MASVQRPLPPMEVMPLESHVSTPLKSLESWRTLVVRAFGRAGLSQKHAAFDMGLNEAQLSRQLAGIENLSFWKMHTLPPVFWQEAIALLCEYHNVTIGQTVQERTDCEIGRLVREAVGKVVAR